MTPPKFHAATTIDGITVDIRATIDPVDGPLTGEAFVVNRVRHQIADAIQQCLILRADQTVGVVQIAIRDGLEAITLARRADLQQQEQFVVIRAKDAATKAAAAISDRIILRLKAENDALRNQIGALEQVKAADKPRRKTPRAKKGGAK